MSLIEKVTAEQTFEGDESVSHADGGRASQAETIARAKALRWQAVCLRCSRTERGAVGKVGRDEVEGPQRECSVCTERIL